MGEDFPRVMVMRGAKRRGVRYFGPYSHAWAIRETVDALLRVFPVRTCSAGGLRAGQIGRPCLLGYIGKCSAPCVGRVSEAEHRLLAEEFCDFMAGQTDRFHPPLEAEMREAARAEEFERSCGRRDDIKALQRALEKQTVVLGDGTDCDVIALTEDQLEAAVQVFYVRDGRVRGQRGWVVDKVEDVTTGELVEQFLGQVYSDDAVAGLAPGTQIPDGSEEERSAKGSPRCASKPAEMRTQVGLNASIAGAATTSNARRTTSPVAPAGSGTFDRQPSGGGATDLVRLARARVERRLVRGDVEHRGVVPEHRLRPVAVVHVPINDEDALPHRHQSSRRHGDVVQQARSPWNDRQGHDGPAAGWRRTPRHRRADAGRRSACRPAPARKQCGLPRVGRANVSRSRLPPPDEAELLADAADSPGCAHARGRRCRPEAAQPPPTRCRVRAPDPRYPPSPHRSELGARDGCRRRGRCPFHRRPDHGQHTAECRCRLSEC